MRIQVFFTPLGVTPQDVAGRPVLVIDVLRATTTIVAALASGAKTVVPVVAADDAIRIAQNLERDGVLLAGERKAVRIEGFALGNSPGEMTREAVDGKMIVMSTTNGTPALVAAEAGNPVLVAAATNFSAVVTRARAAFEETGELVILCAGKEKRFALEDAYAAGRFALAAMPAGQRRKVALDDGALAALELARRYGDKWKNAVRASTAAKELARLGFRADVAAATEVDRHAVVPVLRDKQVTLATQG
jgi:2-phosphosulfolactate phosphatase